MLRAVPRSLLMTFFGAFLRRLGGWIAVADLVALMGDLELDEQAVRSAVSRLKRRGVIAPERRARGGGPPPPPRGGGVPRRGGARGFWPGRRGGAAGRGGRLPPHAARRGDPRSGRRADLWPRRRRRRGVAARRLLDPRGAPRAAPQAPRAAAVARPRDGRGRRVDCPGAGRGGGPARGGRA